MNDLHYDFYFMTGFRAANKAYDSHPEYFNDAMMEISGMGLAETWSQYSEYNFANYLPIKMPEDEKLKDAVYEGVKAAMDCFLLKAYLKTERVL